MPHVARPRLRALDATVQRDGPRRVLVLRDPAGVTDAVLGIPWELLPVLQRFDGGCSHREIHGAIRRDGHQAVTLSDIRRLAETLDAHGFLHGPTFHARRDAMIAAWRGAAVRPHRFAGGAYENHPEALRASLDGHLRAAETAARRGRPPDAPDAPDAPVRALVSPHIDLHRGGAVYGRAWAALARRCEADTFFVLGTCHAAMRGGFAITDKDFDTPLGAVPCARDVVASIERACDGVDLRLDEMIHRGEHSIEFQAVWLRHVLRDRAARIVPVLVGTGGAPARGTEPAAAADYARVLDALRAELVRLGPRACVIAGVDMAHVGPRFGDPSPPDDAARAGLARRDRASLDHAFALDASGWYRDVLSDDAARRVCGLAPVYALAAIIPPAWGLSGRLLGYDQAVDPTDGSVVTYAAAAYTP